MTTETQNLPGATPSPQAPLPSATPEVPAAPQAPGTPDAKLALDEFNEAMGDGEIKSASGANEGASAISDPSGLEVIYDIPVNIMVILGRTQIEVSNLLALDKGDIVELDRKVGEAVDIVVNNRLVARGEIVLVEDRLGITMTEIIKSNQTG